MIKKKGFGLLLLVLCLVMGGCAKKSDVNYEMIAGELNVVNVDFTAEKDEILDKLKDEEFEEPCGCTLENEYVYAKIKLTLVFDTGTNQIKSLTTNNKTSTFYGVKIGANVVDLKTILLEAGYQKEKNSNVKFIKDRFRVTILSIDGTTISGYKIEVLAKAN